MSLADRIEQLKSDKEQAALEAKQELDTASNKILTKVFENVAKDEDALARIVVEGDAMRVCLAQYKSNNGSTFFARLLGGNPKSEKAVKNITQQMIEGNEAYTALCDKFSEAGYNVEFVQLDNFDNTGPHGLDELWYLGRVTPKQNTELKM